MMNRSNQKLNKADQYVLRLEEKARQEKKKNQKRFLKRFLLWAFVFLGLGGAVFGMAYLVKNSSFSTASFIDAVTSTDWIRGVRNGKTVLVEYSDFQCPACARYEPILRQLEQEFGQRLEFVYRYFPLRQIHINAELSAAAAEAAGKQGKFWEMHDTIFDHQNDWAESPSARTIFIGYAEGLKLDMEKFKSDFDSGETADRIEKDFRGGERAGVNSTPTFFLNGQKIPNPRTYAEFQTLINQTIAGNP